MELWLCIKYLLFVHDSNCAWDKAASYMFATEMLHQPKLQMAASDCCWEDNEEVVGVGCHLTHLLNPVPALRLQKHHHQMHALEHQHQHM